MKATILLLCSDPVIRAVIAETLEEDGFVVSPVRELRAFVDACLIVGGSIDGD